MGTPGITAALSPLILALVYAAPSILAEPSQLLVKTKHYIYPTVMGEVLRPNEPPGIELSDRGRNLRGMYIPVGRLVSWKVRKLVSWVKAVGANAVIMDIKDDRGRITFTNELPLFPGSPHGVVPKMGKLVTRLKEEGIYTIGRLVCFKDNHYSRRKPELAIRDKRDDSLWRDPTGTRWMDPFSMDAHEYIAAIATAAAELDFDEIQLDYVRFPVDVGARWAKFPSRKKEMARYEAIAALLARVDHQLSSPLSIDVFGLTSRQLGDKEGLGQSLEHLAPFLDAISPMLYLANWPRVMWENPHPRKTHQLVHNAILKIRSRLGEDIAVRPLLQGFPYRAQNFGVAFLSNQISAADQAGSNGYLFWNQAGNYRKLAAVWRRMDAEEERLDRTGAETGTASVTRSKSNAVARLRE